MLMSKRHDHQSESTSKEVENIKVASINPQPKRWTRIIILGIIILVPALLIGGLYSYSYAYHNKIYEGVLVGHYSLGGMTREQAVKLLDNLNKRYQEQGIVLNITTASGTSEKIALITKIAREENTVEIARFDTEAMVKEALTRGRSGVWYKDLIDPVLIFINKVSLKPAMTFNKEVFFDHTREALASYENPSRNARITISSLKPFEYEIIPEEAGVGFDYDQLEKSLKQRLETLTFDSLTISPRPATPTITREEVAKNTSSIPSLLTEGITLMYEDATSTISQKWKLTPEQLSKWIMPLYISSSNQITFGVDSDKVKEYLEANISRYINRQSRDAVFRMEGERVVEFKGSIMGQSIDYALTAERLNEALVARAKGESTSSTLLAVKVVEPATTVAQANTLGITDIIGVGFSSYKGSSASRLKNITRAAQLLNGTIVKPGEIFSTNKYAGPYTLENGFVPEMVIKGREIKPEVGGGLCQIGTTMFRTAMNSGLPITERAAHGLVVNYYSDHRNGLPGTDATLYEPILDLKFENDTGHALLLQTEIDRANQRVVFTLWGKPDGRKGFYTAPVVERWIPAGPAEEVMVTTLPPGTKKCQGSFRGAVARFTYTRLLPGGEQIDRVFESNYRPLPTICMVGAETAPTDNSLVPFVDTPTVIDSLAPAN